MAVLWERQRTQLPALQIPFLQFLSSLTLHFPPPFSPRSWYPWKERKANGAAELQDLSLQSERWAQLPCLAVLSPLWVFESMAAAPAAPWWPEMVAAAERQLEVQTPHQWSEEKKMTS